MSVAGGPFAIVASVLAVSGVFKLNDPRATAAMLSSLRVPGARRAPASDRWAPSVERILVRAIGGCEVLIGMAALLFGGRALASLVAVAYLCFAVVTVRLLRLGDAAGSCGCFGRLSARPSRLHVAVDLSAAAVALVGTVVDGDGLVHTMASVDGTVVVGAGLIALGTWLVVAMLTVLPATMAATRRGPGPATVRTFQLNEQREVAGRS